MPVESCAIFDREMKGWSDKTAGTRFIFGGVGQRPIWERALDVTWYFARAIDERTKPKAGTREFVDQRRYAQWQAIKFIANLGKIGVPLGLSYLGGEKFPLQKLFGALFNPERIALPQGLAAKEVGRLSLLDGREGLGYLCNDVIVASAGINKDNFRKVDFNDPLTWGHSELRQQIESLNNFLTTVRSLDGRERLRTEIVEQAKGNWKYIHIRNASLDRLEQYIAANNLSPNLSESQLRAYFLSIGYTEQDWQLIADLAKVWQTQQTVPGLQQRIDSCKLQIPVSRREMNQLQIEKAEILLEETGLKEYVDAETLLGFSRSFVEPINVADLKTAVGHAWYPDQPAPPTLYGESSILLFPLVVALMLRRSPQVTRWGMDNLRSIFLRRK